MNLDAQQQTAVTTNSDNALVVAGAGSGKTRVLIERIAHLIEDEKVSPFEITAFSFSRKSSNEVRDRLEVRIGAAAHKCLLGTMHSVALKMLRKFGEIIGLRPDNITIYSEWESSFLLKEVAIEIGFFKKSWKIPKKEIDAMFSAYYEKGEEPDQDAPGRPLFAAFMQRCKENNALTYGALLIGLEMLIPTMAKFMRIRHVLVDEVQDIDPLQWRIINKMWNAFGASIFVVGDIRQSIYSFRGAVPEYLLQHKDDFRIFELQSNYRSVPAIVNAANRVMENSAEFIGGGMLPTRKDGASRVIVQENMDSAFTADLMAAYHGDFPEIVKETAILARNHFLLKKLSSELEARGVPHTYIGRKTALTNSEEFRRFHAFLKLIVNPFDDMAFLLVRQLLGLSQEQYANVRVAAATGGKSHFQAFIELDPGSFLVEARAWSLHDLAGNIECMLDPSLNHWLGDVDWRPEYDFEPSLDFVWEWCELNPRGTVKQYLDWLAVYDIQDELAEETEGLTLCTIHAAKGLEWPSVIVAGCNEGIIPSKQAIASGELEEERRLFYVAITRARDQLVIAVRPEAKEVDGKVHESPRSRFVGEAIGDGGKN